MIKRGQRPELVWGIGLSERDEAGLQSALHPEFRLRSWPAGEKDKLPKVRDLNRDNPILVCISWSAWTGLGKDGRKLVDRLDTSQRVLVLEEGSPPLGFEKVAASGFMTALQAPLDRALVQDAVYRAMEIQGLYTDIFRMTQEIILERELLTRKTDQLMFLNRILTRATESLDIGSILACAREDLNVLFPVADLFGVFWQPAEGETLAAEMFMRAEMLPEVQEAWIGSLLESAQKFSGERVKSYQTTYMDSGADQGCCKPESGRLILMPLGTGSDYFGCLAIHASEPLKLAKDQIETMHAAVRHLGLALRNGLSFRKIKTRADHDGLTRVYNRSAFDERLIEELRRHQRYQHDVSILLMDLDHFKRINDTYGHQAGDVVLRETARLLTDTLRSTDFVARYGGEEFVIILPHTNEEQAWVLAERLRTKVARKTFEFAGRGFKVTASLGVASVRTGALTPESDLVRMADKALYLAKASGRNMVCVSGTEQEFQVVGK